MDAELEEMNPQQAVFLVQARSDFGVFETMRSIATIHPCHLLHYLQMATEKLGKAHAWKHGPNTTSHRAMVGFLKSLKSRLSLEKRDF